MDSSRAVNARRQLAKEQRSGRKISMLYYGETLNDDFIKRFVVLNGHRDPTMKVFSECADGTTQEWLRIEEDGRSFFLAPDGYLGGAIAWVHDQSLLVERLIHEQTKVISVGG